MQVVFGIVGFAEEFGYLESYLGDTFQDGDVVVFARLVARVVGAIEFLAQVATRRVFHKGAVTGVGEVDHVTLFAFALGQSGSSVAGALGQTLEFILGEHHREEVGILQYVLSEVEGELAQLRREFAVFFAVFALQFGSAQGKRLVGLLEQHLLLGGEVELVATLQQDLLGAVVGLAHDALNLLVDAARRLLGVVLVVGVVAAQEHLMLGLAKDLHAERLAHAEARYHLAGHLGGSLEVVGGAARHVVAHELLGNAAAQEDGELVEQLVLGLEVVVLGRQLHGVAERLATRDDRDLVHRVGVLEHVPHERMAALVVGDGGALRLGHHAGLLGRARDHALHGLLDLVHADPAVVAARGQKRGLVQEVRQVGTRKAHRELGELGKVDGRVHGLVVGMDLEDLLAARHVGAIHRDLAVKAAGAQQRRVEDVGAVGGGNEDDALGLLEAVHLDQQLVQGLLALVVTAAEARAALAAHRVDLVDEDDGGRLRLGLLKEVAHAARAHAHEHLHKVGARDREERHARLAGNGLGKQRLARARRAHQKHAARNLGAELAVALGMGEEVLDLLQLLDGLVDARHVFELDLGARGLVGLGVGLAELHGLVVGAEHLAHEKVHDHHEQNRGQQLGQELGKEVGVVGVDVVGHLGMLGHELRQRVGPHVGRCELLGLDLGVHVGGVFPVGAVEGAVDHRVRDRVDAALLHRRHKLAGGELSRRVGRLTVGHVHHEVDHENDDQEAVEPVDAAGTVTARAAEAPEDRVVVRKRVARVAVLGRSTLLAMAVLIARGAVLPVALAASRQHPRCGGEHRIRFFSCHAYA